MAGIYRFEDFELDTDQGELRRQGEPVTLPKLSYRTLVALVEAAPNVLASDDMVRQVWGEGRVITQENLSQRIKMLRTSLGDTAKNPLYIEVVRGRGFRFVHDVTTSLGDDHTSGWMDGKDLTRLYSQCSIAVTPFRDESSNQNLLHIARGIASELLVALAQNRRIRVAANSLHDIGAAVTESAKAIGERLEVNYVLEGSVRSAGNAFKLSTSLVRVSENYYVWSETFECAVGDAFTQEKEIAAKIDNAARNHMFVDVLQQQVDVWKQRFADVDPEAVQLYLQAQLTRYSNSLHGPLGVKAVRELVDRAIEIDNNFAAAHVARTGICRQMHYAGTMSLKNAAGKIDESLLKLESLGASIDPFLAGQIAISIHMDYARAESCFKRAVRNMPDTTPWSYYFLAAIAAAEGRRRQASRFLEEARHLSPRYEGEQSELDISLAYLHTAIGNYDVADQLVEKALGVQVSAKGRRAPLFFKGYNLLARGDIEGMRSVFDELWEDYGSSHPELCAFLMAHLGDKKQATEHLREARPVPAEFFGVALGWVAVGEPEKAIDLLKQAVSEHQQMVLITLRLGAYWDGLRDLPGFIEMLGEMNHRAGYTAEFEAPA